MGACGRADITAEAGDYLYVFELKVTDNSKVALVLENNSKSREKSDTPVCEIVALEKVDNWI